MKKPLPIRQGDVFLHPVAKLPDGAVEVPPESNRTVLAHGEATGHAHAIHEAAPEIGATAAGEIVEALIARCKLYEHKGDRYLVVHEPVNLSHEEHSPHIIPPGVYEIPVQVAHSAEFVRQVAD